MEAYLADVRPTPIVSASTPRLLPLRSQTRRTFHHLNLDFDTSLADILELSGGFDLNLFAEGGIGFAFDANAPDLGSTFLIDSAAGTGENLSEYLPEDMKTLLGVNEGSPELVVGVSLESTQDLEGRLGFLELAAGSSDTNVLGIGSAAEGEDPEIEPEDDPFLSGALLLGLDLNGPGDGLVPLADLDQLSICECEGRL